MARRNPFSGLILLACMLALDAGAATAPASGVKTMLAQGVSLSRERRSLEAQQVALLKQQAELNARGKALAQQQAALNQDIEANNQAIAQHNGKLDQTKSGCKPGETSGPSQTNDCNKDIKSLNQASGDLGAQQALLKQRQVDLNAALQRHGQDVQAWNEHERKTVARLNGVYQGQNNWMDAANSLIVSEGFQALVSQANAGKRCTGTVPRGDRLTLEQLQKYSDAITNCLGYVVKHAGDAAG